MRSVLFSFLLVVSSGSRPAEPGQVSISAAADLLAEPGGRVVATLSAAARVTPGATRQGFTEATLEGYVDSTLIGAARDSFPATIRAASGALLRASAAANAAVLAKMNDGMGVRVVSRSGRWVRVRRTGWVASRVVPVAPRVAAVAVAPPARSLVPAVAAAASAEPKAQDTTIAAAAGALTPRVTAVLHARPNGVVIGAVTAGAILTPLARQGTWTRVRVEAWVPDTAMIPADTALRTTISAADLRADPEGTRGVVVQWTVQVVALQSADALRRDFKPNEPYILARGPADEEALLYLAVPSALLETAKTLAPLSTVIVTARVRTGRSVPAGVPLLDLLSLAPR